MSDDTLRDLDDVVLIGRPLAPEGRTRCPACKTAYVDLDDDDCDEELDGLLVSRRVCKCRFARFLNVASELGWCLVLDYLVEQARPTAARAGVPSRMWPVKFSRPNQAPTVHFGLWLPEWAVRVLEVRVEGVFTRGSSRGMPAAVAERVLRRIAGDPGLAAALLTTYRVAGEQVFADLVLGGGTMPDHDRDPET